MRAQHEIVDCATGRVTERHELQSFGSGFFADNPPGALALSVKAIPYFRSPSVAGCEDPRIDGVRRNGDEISTAVGSMLFAGKEKRGGMGEPVLRSLEFHPCGGLRVVKRYTSGRSAEYCQN